MKIDLDKIDLAQIFMLRFDFESCITALCSKFLNKKRINPIEALGYFVESHAQHPGQKIAKT